MPELNQNDYYAVYDPTVSSFTTGFTVGLFAGAAGYFLFGTKRGAAMRKKMVAEWEEAKQHLVQQGVLENPEHTLGGFLKDLMQKALVTEQVIEEQLSPSERKKTRSPHVKKETTKKFRGV